MKCVEDPVTRKYSSIRPKLFPQSKRNLVDIIGIMYSICKKDTNQSIARDHTKAYIDQVSGRVRYSDAPITLIHST